MIYLVPMTHFPSPEKAIETLSYNDDNGYEWRIARVERGFFLAYFGSKYFMETYLDVCITPTKNKIIINTGCFVFKDADFETFCIIRDILKNGCTDDIWEALEEALEERLRIDPRLTEYEVLKK